MSLRSTWLVLLCTVVSGFHLKMSIDSHLHVWSNGEEPYPYIRDAVPPNSLKDTSNSAALLEEMNKADVRGALIVQPINHLFDHRYVEDAIRKYPERFKGMCLLDPSTEDENYLKDLRERGFCSVRYNPYLPEWGGATLGDEAGKKFYTECGELEMPVGFMCFKGLNKHIREIEALLEASPSTKAIIDHWGFFVQDGAVVDESWEQLLALAKYPQVYVKVSAPFRNVVNKEDKTHSELKGRVRTLIDTFGATRIMWGTDFPFVMLEDDDAYSKSKNALSGWGLSPEEEEQVLSGTVEGLLGKWGA